MSSKWIKKGDKVLIIAGNDKGKIGEVLARKNERIIVQGVNVRKKHVKRREQQSGGDIVSIERPVHISNVSLCDQEGSLLKLRCRTVEGNKELFYLKSGKETVYRTIRKTVKYSLEVMSRLQKKYKEEVKKKLQEKYSYTNPMLIPGLKKVVISMGLAEALKDKNVLQDSTKELARISGQKPIVRSAKKSISNFKLREGSPIGLKVTLRGKRMYDFVDRFTNIVSPRIRDFRGFNRKCDGRGNYTIGVDDQQVFPEINLDEVKRVQGMNITFVTTAQTDEECQELLTLLGMPFKPIQEN